jgi:TetR/AcrR family transcriptional regulator
MRRGRKRVENPATARRILAAAEQQFAAQGMAGARTDEIASAAHANKAMLYYYFGDKRRLHRAVLENLLRELRNGVSPAATQSGTPRERLLKYFSSYFDFLVTHPNYPRLMQREAMAAGPNFDWIVREYLRPFHNRFVRTIEEGIAAGDIRRVDAHHATFTILGATTSYFAAAPIMSEVAGHNLLAPHAVAARKRALLDFVEHGFLRKGSKHR